MGNGSRCGLQMNQTTSTVTSPFQPFLFWFLGENLSLSTMNLFIRKLLSFLMAIIVLGMVFCLILAQKIVLSAYKVTVDDIVDFRHNWVNILLYVAPMAGVSICDSLSLFILRQFPIFLRSPYFSDVAFFTMFIIFISRFLNSGLMVFLSNWDVTQLYGLGKIIEFTLKLINWHKVEESIKLSFRNFNIEWYLNVGSSLVITQLSISLVATITEVLVYLVRISSRIRDQSFQGNPKKTKKILQQDYEDLYLGREFNYSLAYAQAVAAFYMGMTFSPGVPTLYGFTLGAFALNFWINKILSTPSFSFFYFAESSLVFRYYQKPASIDSRLATWVLDFMYSALYVHCIVGFYMIGDSDVMANYFLHKTITNFENQNTWYFLIFRQFSKYFETGAFIYIILLLPLAKIQIMTFVYRRKKHVEDPNIPNEKQNCKKKKLRFFERVPLDAMYMRIKQINQKIMNKQTVGIYKKVLVTQRIRIVNAFDEVRKSGVRSSYFVGVPFYRVETHSVCVEGLFVFEMSSGREQFTEKYRNLFGMNFDQEMYYEKEKKAYDFLRKRGSFWIKKIRNKMKNQKILEEVKKKIAEEAEMTAMQELMNVEKLDFEPNQKVGKSTENEEKEEEKEKKRKESQEFLEIAKSIDSNLEAAKCV